ncbi:hypothetical protein Drorol1_Dr00025293, partial [Drosera rotundifolia]
MEPPKDETHPNPPPSAPTPWHSFITSHLHSSTTVVETANFSLRSTLSVRNLTLQNPNPSPPWWPSETQTQPHRSHSPNRSDEHYDDDIDFPLPRSAALPPNHCHRVATPSIPFTQTSSCCHPATATAFFTRLEDEFLVVVRRIPLDGGGDGRAVADWLMVMDETVNGFDERLPVPFVMGCRWIWVVDGF